MDFASCFPLSIRNISNFRKGEMHNWSSIDLLYLYGVHTEHRTKLLRSVFFFFLWIKKLSPSQHRNDLNSLLFKSVFSCKFQNIFLFYRKFQPITSASDNGSLLSYQNTNRFFVYKIPNHIIIAFCNLFSGKNSSLIEHFFPWILGVE